MTGPPIIISGVGIVSALGTGPAETRKALQTGWVATRPLSLFPTPDDRPLPVGEIRNLPMPGVFPRTHVITRMAARQALEGVGPAPDAVVLGTTTGGMSTTERLIRQGVGDPQAYRFHSPASVSQNIAQMCGCRGPVLTVSTACSSGAVAIKIALELIRNGKARRVLVGGTDGLSRLTYYGFSSLQLIDPKGARPLDLDRRGMTVAEGAAMLLIEAGDPRKTGIEILGAGLSCDAFHPTSPHPDGAGALAAMSSALDDAGLTDQDIDYINLHGTGTADNDLSEARAVRSLFRLARPPLSSVKGAMGHSLAAAGAIEAVISQGCVAGQWVPGNSGLKTADPALKLKPLARAQNAPVRTVLSNSFGFGGNNASVVIGRSTSNHRPAAAGRRPLTVLGSACITGAGHADQTYNRFAAGKSCQGMLPAAEIARYLPPKQVRRLRRLPRLALALAQQAHLDSGRKGMPQSIFLGTGWGALSETHRFLTGLFDSGEKFPSPTDFIGSVHNAPAGQIAMMTGATGANVTTTGGNCSFEQALMVAGLLAGGETKNALVLGVDETHEHFSRLLDPSCTAAQAPSDGGGALVVGPGLEGHGVCIDLAFYSGVIRCKGLITELVNALGRPQRINTRFGFVLAGIPAGDRPQGAGQLHRFRELSGFNGPVIDYRKLTGEFASASAVAAVAAVRFTAAGHIPGALCGGEDRRLKGKGGLVLGLGSCPTAMEVARR